MKQDDIQQEPFAVETIDLPVGNQKKPDSRFKQLARKVGIWVLAVLGFSLALMLVFYFALYHPINLRAQALEEQATEMEGQLSEYRTELSDLTSRYETVTAERDDLLADKAQYQLFVDYLLLQIDLRHLQVGFLEEDNAAVRVALLNAQEHLTSIAPMLREVDSEFVDLLQGRLVLLKSTSKPVEENVQDVERMFNYLLSLQDTLFGNLD
jgi:chromosome segregation ATPase